MIVNGNGQRLNEEMQALKSEGIDTLKQDFGQLSRDVRTLVSMFKDLGTDQVESARESIGEEITSRREDIAKRRDEVMGSLRRAKTRGHRAEQSLEAKIAHHPVRSVVLAFGVGYIAARISKRK
jgi:ElaB/YqjD/DUF883 family membrane-anchored ribosome-binding protein